MTSVDRSRWIVIGIAGVTCGGKTTLANRLRAALAPVDVFHQDHYFYPDDSPRHVRCAGLQHNNYDVLSALDMDAMHRDVLHALHALRGHRCERARDTCDTTATTATTATTGTTATLTAPGKRFLVMEGFTVLNYKPLLDLCHLRYYVVLPYGECASRRALRLYSPPDVAGYFERCVWPQHLHYRAQIEQDESVKLLDGTRSDMLDTVIHDLRALGASETRDHTDNTDHTDHSNHT